MIFSLVGSNNLSTEPCNFILKVCGEDRECEFFRFDPIDSLIGQEAQMSNETDAGSSGMCYC